MAQAPDWRQLIEAGMQFTELHRSQAKRIAQELLGQGQIARDQLSATVEELLELSRRRTEDLTRIVRQEVQRQLGVLGIATKDDLARVERRLAAVTTPTPAARKAAAKRATKKAPAKKAAAKKAPAKKAAAKKVAAKKARTGAGRAATDGAQSA
jgi:polyhydroxyalkanoate synthesis regulator phasin